MTSQVHDQIRRSPERWAAVLLGLVIVAYAGLALYLGRGARFNADDLGWVLDSDGFGPRGLLLPHLSHLVAVTRVLYASMLATVGPDELVIRVALVVAVSAVSILLWRLVSRRLGPLVALAPAVIVLFMGLTPEVILPSFAPFPQSIAFGLGALLAIERRDRIGDLAACALLVLSVAALEVGLAFVLAVATHVLIDRERRRSWWVVALPVVLFAAWWLWARRFDESFSSVSNLLVLPAFGADALASATATLFGLGKDLTGTGAGGTVSPEWGRVLVPLLAAAVAWRVTRRGVSTGLLAGVALAMALCSAFALGFGIFRTPDIARYAYPLAIAVIIILVEAFRGAKADPTALAVLAAVLAFALAANLDGMRQGAADLREQSRTAGVEQAMIELERNYVQPDFNAQVGFADFSPAGDYLSFVDEHGSLATPLTDVPSEPAAARETADQVLIKILEPRVAHAPRRAKAGGCSRVVASEGQADFALPPGGADLRSALGGSVSLSRFGPTPVAIPGRLPRRLPASIAIPTDAAPQPWLATVETASSSIDVCRLIGTEGSG